MTSDFNGVDFVRKFLDGVEDGGDGGLRRGVIGPRDMVGEDCLRSKVQGPRGITDNKNFYAGARNSNFRDDSLEGRSSAMTGCEGNWPSPPAPRPPAGEGSREAGEGSKKVGNNRKNSRKLTGKEEKFCYLVAIGLKNQSEAYRMAYDCKTENKDTINNLAYKLCRKDEIRARINELRKEADESVYWSINDAVKTIDYLIVEALNKKSKVERFREVEDGVDLFGNPIYKKVKTIEEVDKKQLGIVAKLLDMRFKLTGKYREEASNVIMTGEINFNLNALKSGKVEEDFLTKGVQEPRGITDIKKI